GNRGASAPHACTLRGDRSRRGAAPVTRTRSGTPGPLGTGILRNTMKTNMRTGTVLVAALAMVLAACGDDHAEPQVQTVAAAPDGDDFTVNAAQRTRYLHAAGVVRPIADATLSTKLMGSVSEVMVQEGDVVRRGQPLLRIDARDLGAQRRQVEAGLAEAEAVLAEAELHVRRMRALYAEEAAPRAQLDAAETGYTRALAAVAAARASAD